MNFISHFPSLHYCSILALTLRILLNRLRLVSIKVLQNVESYPKQIMCFTFLLPKQRTLFNSKYSLQNYLPKAKLQTLWNNVLNINSSFPQKMKLYFLLVSLKTMAHYSMQPTHAPSTTLLSSLMISALIKLIGKRRMIVVLFSYKIKLFCLECFINKNWMNLTNIFHLITILYLNMHRGFAEKKSHTYKKIKKFHTKKIKIF